MSKWPQTAAAYLSVVGMYLLIKSWLTCIWVHKCHILFYPMI